MRQLRQLLRLARDGASARDIAVTLGVARSTIQDNLKRAAAAGLAAVPDRVRWGVGRGLAQIPVRGTGRSGK